MDTRRNNVVVTLFALFALIFSGCQEVEDLASGATPGNIQIDTVVHSWDNAELNNKSTVTFQVTVKNLGGLDSAGAYVSAYVDNKLIGQMQTGPMGSAVTADLPAQKTVSIKWDAIAGEHTAVFLIKTDSSKLEDAAHRIELNVAVAELALKEQNEVTVEKAQTEVKTLVKSEDATETVADIVENVEQKLTETTDDNEVAVLQTIKVIADEDLTISEEAAPTEVVFATEEDGEEEPAVTALFIPLAKKVDDGAGSTTTEVEEGAFLVSITTEIEEEVSAEVTDTGVVKVTEKKQVAVPLAVKKDTVNNTTTIKNGLGGITINADGTVDLISLPTRAIADEFWPLVKKEIAAAAVVYVQELSAAQTVADQLAALVKLIGKVASIITAYELQSAVTNEKPVITVEASKKVLESRKENDLVRVSYDAYTAIVTDDKDGAKFVSSGTATAEFDPGVSESLEPVSFTFTAQDSDGETATFKVVSKYTRQVIENYYVHDQGAVTNQ